MHPSFSDGPRIRVNSNTVRTGRLVLTILGIVGVLAFASEGRAQPRISELAEGLRSPHRELRLVSARLLGERALFLNQRLQTDASAAEQLRALRSLGPELSALAREEHSGVRQAALRTLGQVRAEGEVVYQVWNEALARSDPGDRQAAAESIGIYVALASKELTETSPSAGRLALFQRTLEDLVVVFEPIGRALRSTNPDVPAARTLLRSHDPSATNPPAERIRDVLLDALVRLYLGLGRLVEFKLVLVNDDAAYRLLRANLVQIMEESSKLAPEYDALLRHGSPKHQIAVAEILENLARLREPLRKLPASRAAEPVERVDNVLDPEGEKAAAFVSQTLRQTMNALISAAATGTHDVRLAALETLGLIGKEADAAIPVLLANLHQDNPFVIWATLRALGYIGTGREPGVVEAVTCFLGGPDLDLAIAATQALGRFGPEARAAVPQLAQALLRDDRALQTFTIETLRAIGKSAAPSIPALAETLRKARTPGVRRQAARLLGELGKLGAEVQSAVPALQEALSDPEQDVRLEAGNALFDILRKQR
jgi:HEAT repeat protein